MPAPKSERNEKIYLQYLAGTGPTALARKFKVSRTRVKQIVEREAQIRGGDKKGKRKR